MAGSSVRNRKRGASRHSATTVRPTGSPIFAPWSARKIPFIAAAIVFGASLVLWLPNQTISSSLKWRWLSTPPEKWEERRLQVKDAFVSSWDAYSKYAWGWSIPFQNCADSNTTHQAMTNFTPSPKRAQ
jgi:hypothetical protein